MRLENKTPAEGSFAVESDRAIMKVLSLVAHAITGKVERGGTFSVLAAKDFAKSELSQSSAAEAAGAAEPKRAQ